MWFNRGLSRLSTWHNTCMKYLYMMIRQFINRLMDRGDQLQFKSKMNYDYINIHVLITKLIIILHLYIHLAQYKYTMTLYTHLYLSNELCVYHMHFSDWITLTRLSMQDTRNLKNLPKTAYSNFSFIMESLSRLLISNISWASCAHCFN